MKNSMLKIIWIRNILLTEEPKRSTFSYIAGYSSDKDIKELKASLERIRSAADEMITDIDKSLEKQMKREQSKAVRDEAR